MKKLKEFIAWVGKQKGFEGMNPDQVITALNEMSSSEEGKAEVAKLMSAFKQDQKISDASEVLKAQSGAALRSAQRQEYRNAMNEYRNDAEMGKYRRGYLRDMARERANAVVSPTETPIYDRQKARDIMESRGIGRGNYGDNRVLAKKAKAAATSGFNESMYNWDQNQEFDRGRFRDRKQIARLTHPEYNWRQRRAFALMDADSAVPSTKEVVPIGTYKSQTPNLPSVVLPKTFDLPKLEIAERGPVWIDTKSATTRTPIVNNEKINTNVDWNSFMEEPKIAMVSPTNPVMTVEQFRNHPNFRKHYLGHKTITINGVEYPVAVTTGMYGNNLGIDNDHTYAYDPKTGKIRKVEEDATFGHIGFYGRGFDKDSEWIDMPPAEGWTYQQTGHNMNYRPATYRTAHGQFYKK